MGRVNITGFELGASDPAGVEPSLSGASASFVTATGGDVVRSGAYSLKVSFSNNQTEGYALLRSLPGGLTDFNLATAWVRFYIYFKDSLPAGSEVNIFESASVTVGTFKLGAYVGTDGSLRVVDTASATVFTSAAGVFTTNTWHRVEFKIPTGTSSAHETRVDGTTLSTATGDFWTSNLGHVILGRRWATTSATATFYMEDCSVDNATWPGPGKIVPLLPTGVGTSDAWTLGAGSTKTAAVSEVPFDSDTSYVTSSTNQATQLFNVTDPADAGVGAGDTLSAVKAVAVVRDLAQAVAGIPVYRYQATTTAGASSEMNASYEGRGVMVSGTLVFNDLNSLEVGFRHNQSQSRALRMTHASAMLEYEPVVGGVPFFFQQPLMTGGFK